MTTVIVDYDSGNLHSAEKAFQRMATDSETVLVSNCPAAVMDADRLVLPGVGAFADCLCGLQGRKGLIEAIGHAVQERRIPFLGICVGMQLLATRGWEHGKCHGLNWIPGDVVKINPADPALKIPHMGWNDLVIERRHPVFNGIENGAHTYFVHSFHFVPAKSEVRLAYAYHGQKISAAVAFRNIVGVQFHPEKSQDIGLRLIRNFLTWNP